MGLFRRKKKNLIACSALVVAAGQSSRMGSVDKVMLPIEGIPVIIRTLQAVSACEHVQEIVVVTRPDLLVPMSEEIQAYGIDKVTKLIVGGADRTESVHLGLQEINADAEYVAIHDGARPFASPALIKRTIEAAVKYQAVAPAVPLRDAIRQSDRRKNWALERESLCAMQTPQVFDADLVRAAIVKVRQEGLALTDDCAAVEHLGMPIHLVEGEAQNIKLTQREDIAIATGLAMAQSGMLNLGDEEDI